MKSPLIRTAFLAALLSSAAAGTALAQSKPTMPAFPDGATTDQAAKEPGLIKAAPPATPPRTKVEIYKQTLPNGQVVYGDAPVAGRKVDKVLSVDLTPGAKVWSAEQDVAAPAAAPKPSYMAPQAKPSDAEKAAKAAEAAQAASRIAAEIEAAEEAHRAAEKELQEGKAPTDGDRARNANGTTRLSEGYFARQKRLQAKMDEANNRLYQAYEAARTANR